MKQIAISCWDEELIRESYQLTKKTSVMLRRLQAEYESVNTKLEKLSLKILISESQMLCALMKTATKRSLKHYLKAGLLLREAWKGFIGVQEKMTELCYRAGINTSKLESELASTDHDLEDDEEDEREEDGALGTFELVEDINSFLANGRYRLQMCQGSSWLSCLMVLRARNWVAV
eukprot:sb/3471894/